MPDSRSGRALSSIVPRRFWLPGLAVLGLALSMGLALKAARTDSLTVDEPSHLLAGAVPLSTGDFRLSPDHPPLARMFLALPLLGDGPLPDSWTSGEAGVREAWRSGDFFTLGRFWAESRPGGLAAFLPSRLLAILVLALLVLTTGWAAGRRFGPAGGLAAAWVLAFDPAFLAHGHLATIDVPFSLVVLWVLLAADRALAEPGPLRLGLLALAFAAACLTKFSFFALIPAVAAMALVSPGAPDGPSRGHRLAALGLVLGLSAFLAIWAAYFFQFSAAKGPDAAAATMHVLGDYGKPRPTTPEAAFEAVLHDPATGRDRPGLAAPLLRFAKEHRLLPEAYLYGVAYVAKKGLTRASYFRGEYSMEGFQLYFPWAFAIKTPLPTLVLFGLALLAALARWRRRPGPFWARPSPLAVGALVFAAVYLAALGSSALNLGVRHLLPVVPLLALAVGALTRPEPVPGLGRRTFPALVVVLLAGSTASTVAAAPHFLGYFNELVGGWRQGHRHLVESNLDWGQDLLRLAERLRREEPGQPIWLAQAGHPPLPPALAAFSPRQLFGDGHEGPDPAAIGGGLYVISASELVGVYRPLARAAAWREARLIDQYERLAAEKEARGRVSQAAVAEPDAFEVLRRLRLLARLAQREPDERVGTSLFLFRLSEQQVREATAP